MTAAFAVAALVGLVGIATLFDAHMAVARRAAGVGGELFAVIAELLHFAVKVFFLDFAVVAVVVAAFEAADLRFGGVFVYVYALLGGGAIDQRAHGGDLIRAKQRGGNQDEPNQDFDFLRDVHGDSFGGGDGFSVARGGCVVFRLPFGET